MTTLDAETLEMMLQMLRDYAALQLRPEHLRELDERDEFPAEVLRELYDPEKIGLHLLFIPEEHGGLGGRAHNIYRISEQMARIDLGIATGVLATFLDTDPITVGGTPEQKADRLVGLAEGQGLAQAQAVFGYTRLMVAAFGLGGGWAALERAVRYAQTRAQGGAPLIAKQAYTHKLLVPNAARLEAARAYIEWVAERIDAGEPGLQTEGAVAKYLASEAGNRAAEDAIQALGGYGYTKEYMVEKIKRDVRITCIYEGTSEIMEWTIARDRWQQHLKTQGGYYRDWAARMERLAADSPDTGAHTAALTLTTLVALLERCRLDRLTRSQHVLFRLGALIAAAETAAVFAERAVVTPSRASALGAPALATLARIYARDAAIMVAADGLRWAIGAGQSDPQLGESLGLPAIYATQAGLIADMNSAAAALAAAFPAE